MFIKRGLIQSSPAVSPGLDHIIRLCLEKEAADRFQSVRDLGFALQAVTSSGISPATPATASPPVRGKKIIALGMLSATILLTALGAYLFGRSRAGLAISAQPQFQQLTFRLGTIRGARFAPDGQTIVYAASMDGAVTRLYTTRSDSPESQALELSNISLFAVSPTGELAVAHGCKYIGNGRCRGILARMPLSGGAPREILPDVTVADWLPDRKELAVVRGNRGQVLVEFPIGKTVYSNPGGVNAMRVSPDGKYVAFAANPTIGNDAGEILIFDAQGKQIAKAGPWNSIQGIAWVSSGTEVWFAASAGNEGWADQIRALDVSGRQRMILRLPGITRLHDISRDGRVLITKEQWRALMPFVGPKDNRERDLSWLDLSSVCDLALDSESVIFTEIGEAPGQDYFLWMILPNGA